MHFHLFFETSSNVRTKYINGRQFQLTVYPHNGMVWAMVKLKVNGAEQEAEAPDSRLLLDFLRNDLGLTGSKEGCGVGVCGACTVLVDGELFASCITLAAAVQGSEITTIEGLADSGELHPVQQAFIDHGGFQCGICTPGQVMAAKALLDHNPGPTESDIRDWMMGNLCRCTGYYGILNSVAAAARSVSQAR